MTPYIAAAHPAWVNEEDKIISFHQVDGYEPVVFEQCSSFTAFILQMIEQHFKFQ
ncbi:MAG: hypothetical protein ACOX81_03065 [Candidatus Heteroscillospira sp.]|jgi:hypothetical protein